MMNAARNFARWMPVPLLATGLLSIPAQAGTASYIYDDWGRLQTIHTDTKTITYTYDKVGNRTQAVVQSGGLGTAIDVGVTLSVPSGASLVRWNYLDYTITARNFSGTGATSLSLVFDLGSGASVSNSNTGSWSCTGTDPVTCTLSTLAAGSASTLTFDVFATQLGPLTNDVTISHGASDLQAANDSANHTVLIVDSGDPNDEDGDGMSDVWETKYGFDPQDGAGAQEDPDGDNLSNLAEYNLGTDPTKADSDGDGLNDDVDPTPTYNPAWLAPILELLVK